MEALSKIFLVFYTRKTTNKKRLYGSQGASVTFQQKIEDKMKRMAVGVAWGGQKVGGAARRVYPPPRGS